MALRPHTRLGAYEIQSALGAGGMGEVYRARDTKLGRDVAIKILPASVRFDPERRQCFERVGALAGVAESVSGKRARRSRAAAADRGCA